MIALQLGRSKLQLAQEAKTKPTTDLPLEMKLDATHLAGRVGKHSGKLLGSHFCFNGFCLFRMITSPSLPSQMNLECSVSQRDVD